MPYANNKGEISLCIRIVWSALLNLLPRKHNTSRCYIRNLKTLASFCSWAGWFESYLVAKPRRQVFSWHGSNNHGKCILRGEIQHIKICVFIIWVFVGEQGPNEDILVLWDVDGKSTEWGRWIIRGCQVSVYFKYYSDFWHNKILALHSMWGPLFSPWNTAVFLSSREPKAHWWASRIGRPQSSICLSSTLFNIFSSENTGPIEAKVHMESPLDWGMKVCSNGPGHMTKMAAMPIYGENIKKSSPEPKANNIETWYAASGARVLPSLFKWWPWVDLDLFYGKIKFGPLCFCIAKR